VASISACTVTTLLLGNSVLNHCTVQRTAERKFMLIAGRNMTDVNKVEERRHL
jgi:hypothetical protein